jgi:hypothetical protein
LTNRELVWYLQYQQKMTVLSLILALVVIPAVIGYCLYVEGLEDGWSPEVLSFRRSGWRNLFHIGFEPGDFLVYRKPKVSPRPGPRARNIQPSDKGDDYYYEVEKYWRLADVLEDGHLVAVTRTGKRVELSREDENLRKARLLERVMYRRRFPAVR